MFARIGLPAQRAFSLVCVLFAWCYTSMAASAGAYIQDPSPIRVVPQSSQKLILDIQESADGRRLLTHDRKFAPRLWDSKSLHLLLVLSGHSKHVDWLSFSPDGSRVATLSEDEVRFWDSSKAKLLNTLKAPAGNPFLTARFSPDGKTLAIGTEDGSVAMANIETCSITTTMKGQKSPVLGLDYSRDGQRLAACCFDGSVALVSVGSDNVVKLSTGKEPARWSDFSKDGSLIAITSLDDTVKVYNSTSGKLLYSKPHAVGLRGVANVLMGAMFVEGASEALLTAPADGTMKLLDPLSGAATGELKGHRGILREIRVSHDRKRVATYGDDEKLFVWEVASQSRLPFERAAEGPTAGEFSPDGRTFWVGYEGGEIASHDLATGKSQTASLGNILPSFGCVPINDGVDLSIAFGDVWWIQKSKAGNESKVIQNVTGMAPVYSPNGRYVLFNVSTDDEFPGRLVDLAQGKALMRYKYLDGAAFSPDSNRFVTWQQGRGIDLWKTSDGSYVTGWVPAADQPIVSATYLPGSDLIASVAKGSSGIEIWNPETGKVTTRFEWPQLEFGPLAASPDGFKVACYTLKGLRVYSAATETTLELSQVDPQDAPTATLAFSPGSSYIAAFDGQTMTVWSLETGKRTMSVNTTAERSRTDLKAAFSADGTHIVVAQGSEAKVYDTATGKVLMTMVLPSSVRSVFYANHGSRIVTEDESNGLTIWDSQEKADDGSPKAVHLGNLVVIEQDGWLVYDDHGRFDADEPSQIRGAYFVKEWSGGLEAIGMDQLKQGFYEPGLLAKLLGFDKDPLRDVPDLDNLRLYPEVKLEQVPNDPTHVKVSLTDRDDGGIGIVQVWVNGREVAKKSGSGYFTVDLQPLYQFMLPEVYLPDGNVIGVTASNEDGTLKSPPTTLNIGIPQGLKTPDVKVHVLCVGVGDYAGNSGDLKAPPSDAKALAEALVHSANELLPGRADVTVMTTDPDSATRPTKENIKKWFAETAKSATSTDIVFVFLSGHGTNAIADKKGYFFLTSEADPADVTASTLATGTITAEDLRAMLGQIAATKQVVVLDTCHSGAAASNLIGADKSVSGDYQRAWESIKDATGTWMLAGSASDQLSYESTNVEHGVLTYALLEAIDKVSPEGLRPSSGDDYFLDVERWLRYAAERVEGLKSEVGLTGIQKPEFKRSTSGTTFDIGVMKESERGRLKLKAPMPIVIVGEFEQDKEDPLDLEDAMKTALRDSAKLKSWSDVSKHPNVYRVAGSYVVDGQANVKLKVYIQYFDADQTRKTLETFEVTGPSGETEKLVADTKATIEAKILAIEQQRKSAVNTGPGSKPGSGG